MVTVINYVVRQNKEGESFCSLVIQGGLEMIVSKQTGKFYATARKTSIPSTLDEATCKNLIGSKIPGTIIKVECEEYEFQTENNGEVITLNHTYEYSQAPVSLEENVIG